MGTKIKLLILWFIIPITMIAILNGVANHKNNQPNGFTRSIIKDFAAASAVLDLTYNSYYLAGITSNKIYLGNLKSPRHLFIAGYSFADTQHVTMADPLLKPIRSSRIRVDSPYAYISNESNHQIFKTSLTEYHTSLFRPMQSFYSDAIPISASTCILKTALQQDASPLLLKEWTRDTDHIVIGNKLLENQGDGWFSTDGTICYNPVTGILVYTYLYMNQFLCIDTNLHLVYKGKTIDTCSRVKIKVGRLKGSNSRSLVSTPYIVNKKSSLSGDLLFIHSGLRADNENKDSFTKSSVVDMYDIVTKNYKGSFYIPHYKGNQMKAFIVSGNTLFGLYDHFLVAYKLQLDPKLFADH